MWGLYRSISAFASRSQKMELLTIYISFQSYVHVKERRNPRSIKKGGVHPGGFSSARASGALDHHDWWLEGHSHMMSCSEWCCFQAFIPFQRTEISQALPVLLRRLAEPTVQLFLTELVLKQLLELQLFSPNGQFYCILMENVIIGWTMFHRKYISLSPTFVLTCSQL